MNVERCTLNVSHVSHIRVSHIRVDQGQQWSKLNSMEHSPGFLKVVNDVRPKITEITVEQARARLAENPKAILMDVREDGEWTQGHAVQAIHLGKGVLERDIEKVIPDPNTELIMYCGGGYRSALTADVAQQMGYRKVASLIGGYKALVQEQWPMAK